MKKLSILIILLPFYGMAQEKNQMETFFFTKNATKNDTTLTSIQADLKSLTSSAKSKFNIDFSLKQLAMKSSTENPSKTEDVIDVGKIVNIKDSIAKLFDPASQPCDLPAKVKNKLNAFKAEQKMWVPKYIVQQLDKLPESALLFRGSGLTRVLHSITILHEDKTTERAIIMGAPTYSSLNVAEYVVGGFNSFAYTLDCAGYLNAAIEASGAVPGADITTSAAASMSKQNSMFVGGGIVVSPLYAAYYGDASGIAISKADRISILNAIISIPGIALKDNIELKMAYEVVWASSQGGEGFNGKAEFSSRGGIGIGVAQVSGSGKSTGNISRTSSFNNFDTFVTNRRPLNKPAIVSVTMINELIKSLNKN